jgi:hypothetical protein
VEVQSKGLEEEELMRVDSSALVILMPTAPTLRPSGKRNNSSFALMMAITLPGGNRNYLISL